MGKQSRRIRQSSVKEQPKTKTRVLTLDVNNEEDTKFRKAIQESKKYEPLLAEVINIPDGKMGIKTFMKIKCREIRHQQAVYVREITRELMCGYFGMKMGDITTRPLDIYYENLKSKISLIKFLTHLHNGNGTEASKYYLRWKASVCRRLDGVLFADCSDEYVEIDGKRYDAKSSEGARLMGECIKNDIGFYTDAWKVLIGTTIPE